MKSFLAQKNIQFVDSRSQYITAINQIRRDSGNTLICLTCIVKEWSDLVIIEDGAKIDMYIDDIGRRICHAIGKPLNGVYFRSASDEITVTYLTSDESDEYFNTLPSELKCYMDYSYPFAKVNLPTRVAIGISTANTSLDHGQLVSDQQIFIQSKLIAEVINKSNNDTAVDFIGSEQKNANELIHQKYFDGLIRRKIQNKDFFPYFQPIYEVKTSELRGFECLARTKIDDNIVSPAIFLATIQYQMLAADLDLVICEKAIASIGVIHNLSLIHI